ncbi:hypothetical protein [Rhizobium leguminosarum]|uniref:hypothetical protein n=1 Tax=Rhizobium leguminosarum TaxID=384 RepID=UPI0024B3BCE7|nr:hypothetical protein [Rhizobium leguminosarum]WHO83815.1 hypothetical protein QMO81_006741 [Rhizobium leguminosarum]
MAINLRNKAGKTIKLSTRHWTVMLTLAETFGWSPAGTAAPVGWNGSGEWGGAYDTNDGQAVSDDDAKALARHLHGAAVSPQLPVALTDVINYVEKAAEARGITILDAMRMEPNEFSNIFSPLLMFLYDGSFYIE